MVDDIAPTGGKFFLDKERTIYFSMKAIRDILKVHGSLAGVHDFFMSLNGTKPEEFTADALDKIALIIAIGLRHEDPTIEPDFVLANIDPSEMEGVSGALGYALRDCMPRPKANP